MSRWSTFLLSEVNEKANDAVDYSDITEVADVEEPEKKVKDALSTMKPPSSGKQIIYFDWKIYWVVLLFIICNKELLFFRRCR